MCTNCALRSSHRMQHQYAENDEIVNDASVWNYHVHVAIDASRRCKAVDVLVHMAVGPRFEKWVLEAKAGNIFVGPLQTRSTEHRLRRFAGDGASEERCVEGRCAEHVAKEDFGDVRNLGIRHGILEYWGRCASARTCWISVVPWL